MDIKQIIKNNTFVINLKYDILKKQIFLQNNHHVSINFKFIEGIYGNEDIECNNIFNNKKNIFISVNQIGYIKSMIKILQNINSDYIMILDDDVIFHKNFNNIFKKLKLPNDFNIFKLGSSNHSIRKKRIFIKSNKNYTICKNRMLGSFAIIINKKIINKILDLCKKMDNPFDKMIYKINKHYVIKKSIIIPDVYKSSILKDRNLYECSKKFGWNLNFFNFKNSLRKVYIITKDIDIIKQLQFQTYKNFQIIPKYENHEFVFYCYSKNINNDWLENKMNILIKNV